MASSIVKKYLLLLLIAFLVVATTCAESLVAPAVTQTISIDQIKNFAGYPANVKNLVTKALELSSESLTYRYGSNNPDKGGMDCSGTINYLLSTVGLKNVPRQANEIYSWAWKKNAFRAVNSNSLQSFEFDQLKPGDLLFWSGTYNVQRDPPITHVMIYLGKNLQGEPLMFGASDGRTYKGKSMNGVSVFDFKLPSSDSQGRFVGYSCIPVYTCN